MAKDWGLALGLSLAAYAIWAYLSQPSPPPTGGPAPALTLEVGEGQTALVPDPSGAVVVLNFWATWCGPCVAEIPELSAYAQEHPEVKLIGVSMDQGLPAARVRAAAKKYGATYPIAMDPGAAGAAYGASVLPTTVVIGGDGAIRATAVGGLTERDLSALVRKARE